MAANKQKTVSPVDGKVYVERPLATRREVQAALAQAQSAQAEWKLLPVAERVRLVYLFVDRMVELKERISEELARQMGRPIKYGPNEVRGFEERARHMASIAEEALADVAVGDKPGFTRFIRREPHGVVFVIAPWNYPYLTSVNAVVPALLAGNSVLLKHSAQTPLVAESYTEAARKAGLPEGVLAHLHLSHDQVARVIADPAIRYVAFTGSVEGGRAIHRAAADRFIHCGLELGGKDPAYVRPDCDLRHAVETLVDGAYYNSGQSCCGIKRVYVHRSVFQQFVDGWVELTRQYRLGNPLDAETTLGPVVRTSAAEAIRGQIEAAIAAGARPLIDEKWFPQARGESPYLAPQALLCEDNKLGFMQDETFGPAAGIMPVGSDDEAVAFMNDSRFGLTAAVFTKDVDAAIALGRRVDTGTWFMNRCDYLDPALAWVGVKDSGVGCTLSRVGFEHLTRPKSFHLKTSL
ncbi:MAG: aldehyde dehydrogenase family protein [Deltaproteobacteria bacterium]|nr:aldehyde dehydrogenase family protein [Deltaproteobacteria bacterium]